MRNDSNVSFLVEEYAETLRKVDAKNKSRKTGHQRLPEVLVKESEWTPAAATHLARLARENGIFILRNALALAIVLKQEDGTLGY